MRTKKLAIIGNGMGTCRLLDELSSRAAVAHYEITVYGEEQGGAYNRIQLGKVLAGSAPDTVVTKTPEWYDANNIRLLDRARVIRVDHARKEIETEDGHRRRYDVAVIATGSTPLVPPIPGTTGEGGELRQGVFVYRTIADCLRMRAQARPGDVAIVLGGGLLGLEAAKVLSDRGLHVTVVQAMATLMNQQLDAMGGQALARHIERCGIFTRTGRTVEAIVGDEAVEGVVLDDGSRLPADMVVMACGVRPRVDVARASGIPVNKGILVNDTLATEIPGIYAFGECAEHRGKLYGIVSPVWEQAEVLAAVLTGRGADARYRGSKLYTRLKVAGVDVASMGIVEPELESDQVLQIIEDRKHAYRKLIIRDGKLVGAMLVGNATASASLIQLFDRGDPLPEEPLEALCIGLPAAGAGDRTVCNCNRVSASEIAQAIAAGADSVESLGTMTRAGTGCGSCRTELTQMLAKAPRRALPLAG